MNTYTLDIRNRRQVTLPLSLLKILGIAVGDSVEIKVKENLITLRPKKQVALEALQELQKAFQKSDISEKEILTDINNQRIIDAKKWHD